MCIELIFKAFSNAASIALRFCWCLRLYIFLQADADSFYTTCNGRQFNSIEDAVCQLVYVERAEVIKSEEVQIWQQTPVCFIVCLLTEGYDFFMFSMFTCSVSGC